MAKKPKQKERNINFFILSFRGRFLKAKKAASTKKEGKRKRLKKIKNEEG